MRSTRRFRTLIVLFLIIILGMQVLRHQFGPSAIFPSARHLWQVPTWFATAKAQSADSSQVDQAGNPDISHIAATGSVQSIAAGGDQTCAILGVGIVMCWGDGRSTPSNVIGLGTNIIAADGGSDFACALTSVGGVKCWGMNTYGQLGNGEGGIGSDGYFYPEDPEPPQDVNGLSTGATVIAVGSAYACALVGGGVKCWGNNMSGQLGNGEGGYAGSEQYTSRCGPIDDGGICRLAPVNVVGLSSGVIDIAAGQSHTCAVTAAGTVKCWGNNGQGQLGTGGSGKKCARDGEDVDADVCEGSVQCGRWGYESCHRTPVDVQGLGGGVKAIAAGDNHTCAVTSAGAVKCWGSNRSGQLGDGTITDRSTAVDVTGLSGGIKAITAAGDRTCALSTGGSVMCWGANGDGQLGDGTNTSRLTPVDVVGLSSGISALAAGDFHTCALTSRGEVKCWGANEYGQLGDGTTTSSLVPVTCTGFTAIPDIVWSGKLLLPAVAYSKPPQAPANMILIPAGTFQMGCDPPLANWCSSKWTTHQIYLDGYRIDKYEVTNAQFRQCVAAGKCTYSRGDTYYDDDDWVNYEPRPDYYTNPKYDDYPIAGIDWYQAAAYCAWRGARLPTEAEWEKAARGYLDTRTYPWGNASISCDKANAAIGLAPVCVRGTDKIGVRPSGASPYGIMDMSGNVSEWVSDWNDDDYYSQSPTRNPQGPASGTKKIVRGGSFSKDFLSLPTVFARQLFSPDNNYIDHGVRCAKSQ